MSKINRILLIFFSLKNMKKRRATFVIVNDPIFNLQFWSEQKANNIFMGIFVVLWSYLLTTKLSFLQKNNFGHTNLDVEQVMNHDFIWGELCWSQLPDWNAPSLVPCAINRITLYLYFLFVVNSGVYFWLICTLGKVKLFLKMYVNHNKTRIITQILGIRQLRISIEFETCNLGRLWSTTTFAFHCRKVWPFYTV